MSHNSVTHTNAYSLSLSLSLSLTHTLSLSLSLSHTHTHTLSISLSLSLSHTHSLSLTHAHTHTHTHKTANFRFRFDSFQSQFTYAGPFYIIRMFLNIFICAATTCRYVHPLYYLVYDGNVNQTVSGLTCQRWSVDVPNVRNAMYTTLDLNVVDTSWEEASNYCRGMMAGHATIWCYTTNPFQPWEECSIPECPGKPLMIWRYILLIRVAIV